MMWEDRDEPLYEERILGERVRFLWKQKAENHFIRAEWVRGENPWDIEVCEAQDTVRHRAIERATQEMENLIHEKKPGIKESAA